MAGSHLCAVAARTQRRGDHHVGQSEQLAGFSSDFGGLSTSASSPSIKSRRLKLETRVGLNASTEERAMMSSWRVTLLALGFRRSNRPARDVDQAIIEG
jgi:hypothetical protein